MKLLFSCVAKSLGGADEGMYRGCNFPLNMPLPVRGIVAVKNHI